MALNEKVKATNESVSHFCKFEIIEGATAPLLLPKCPPLAEACIAHNWV